MTAKYLLANQRRLENRERGKFNGPSWHRFGRTQNLAVQSTQKLCVPRLVDSLVASYDEDGSWFLDNVDVGGITLKESLHGHGLLYLLGLINSKLLRWYFPHVSAPFRGGYLSANKQFLGQLPIRVLDLREPRDAEDHAEIVEVAGRISKLMSGLSEASTEGERTSLKRQVDALDHRLDETVYRLYELTSDEIRMVEERT